MSLEEKLLAVDVFIWNQFKKVNDFCYKRYGTSKYDLACLAEKGSGIAFSGSGIYNLLYTLETAKYHSIDKAVPYIFMSSLQILSGIFIYHYANESYKKSEEEEVKSIIKTGFPASPELSPSRGLQSILLPFEFGAIPLVFYAGGIQNNIQKFVLSLSAFVGLFVGFRLAVDYFSSQVMNPPKTKKNVFINLYDSVRNYLNQNSVAVPAKTLIND